MDQVQPEGGALPSDANASPESDAADAVETTKGSEAESSPAAAESEKPAKPAKSGAEIRIDELTRRLRETERRNERLLRYVEERATQSPAAKAEPQQQAETPKTLKDFNYNEQEFHRYTVERAVSEATRIAEQKAQQAREAEATRARAESWEERFEKFAEEHPEILDGWESLPISKAMGEALQGSEVGPEIGLYLRNNRAVAKELSKMHPFDAAREIGRIEERLAIERKKASEKPVSQAPPPPPKVDAATAPSRISTTSPESDKLSDDEWVKAEQARLRRKAARNKSD